MGIFARRAHTEHKALRMGGLIVLAGLFDRGMVSGGGEERGIGALEGRERFAYCSFLKATRRSARRPGGERKRESQYSFSVSYLCPSSGSMGS